jgi:hypothetical protein
LQTNLKGRSVGPCRMPAPPVALLVWKHLPWIEGKIRLAREEAQAAGKSFSYTDAAETIKEDVKKLGLPEAPPEAREAFEKAYGAVQHDDTRFSNRLRDNLYNTFGRNVGASPRVQLHDRSASTAPHQR